MKKHIITLILKIRATINRVINPVTNRFLLNRSVVPISSKFGFDRGTPIDRYWIESFLEEKKGLINGVCLEVTDNTYTKRFGQDRILKSDVIDIDPSNKLANIHGDLRDLKNVKSDTYDTVILTHVLGLIDEPSKAVSEIYRVLKPGGKLVLTSSCLGPILGETVFWRFTSNSMKYVLTKNFDIKNIEIKTFGNVLTGQAFWIGMSQEELSQKELSFNDHRFPCVVTAIAYK